MTTQTFAILWLVLTMVLFWIVGTYGPRLVSRLRKHISRRRMARELGWRNGWKHLR